MKSVHYLLGQAYAILSQCRQHLIKRDDVDGIELIEDQYQQLENGINELYERESNDNRQSKGM